MKKEKIIQAANEMGKNINLDDFLEKLILIDKVEKGLAQIETNQVVLNSEVELYFKKKWKK
ncbi:MAG: hypothetical protein HY062_06490 [Bacteroidetes bacterium]|nr:hypothetical protein [Bacteroidota bacterium]